MDVDTIDGRRPLFAYTHRCLLFAVLTGLVVVLTACTSTDTAEPSAPTSTTDAEHHVDVFLHPITGDVGRASVTEIIDEIDGTYEYVDQEATLVEFGELFAGDEELLAAVSAADLPPSFRVTSSEPIDEDILERLRAHAAVRQVNDSQDPLDFAIEDLSPDPRSHLSIVYLLPDAGEKGRAEVAEILEDVPGIYFVDQDHTYEEFIAFFEGDEERAAGAQVEDMPPSWRVDLDGGEFPPDVIAELEASPVVRTIQSAAR